MSLYAGEAVGSFDGKDMMSSSTYKLYQAIQKTDNCCKAEPPHPTVADILSRNKTLVRSQRKI